MPTFEYRSERINGRGWTDDFERLSELGWRLVSVDDGIAYFRRPKDESAGAGSEQWGNRLAPRNDRRGG